MLCYVKIPTGHPIHNGALNTGGVMKFEHL